MSTDPRIGWHWTILNAKSLHFVAPAQDSIESVIVVFKSNFDDDTTIYQGPPTDAVDTAWEGLYNGRLPFHAPAPTVYYELTQTLDIGLSQIDKESARRLPNKTAPIPGDEEHYIVGLDVFHQLHCLVSILLLHIARRAPQKSQNHIRKSLYPNRYHLHENLTETEMASAMEHLGIHPPNFLALPGFHRAPKKGFNTHTHTHTHIQS